MTLSSPTRPLTTTDDSTEHDTHSRTTTTTEHYAKQSNPSPEPRTRATRSKDSHRCITIRGCGPACGRPGAPSRAVDLPVDLCKIVLVMGWSPWS
jgi:hypothetical protein